MKFLTQGARAAFDAVLALPPEKRAARLRAVINRAEVRRAERFHEWRPGASRWMQDRMEGPCLPEELLLWGRTDFWAIIHFHHESSRIRTNSDSNT